MKATHKALATVLVVLVLVTAGIAIADAQVKQPAEWITAKRLTVDTSAAIGTDATVGDDLTVTGDAAVGGTFAATGNASFAGTVAVNGSDLAVAAQLAIVPQTAISLTNGGIITPTGTVQEITSSGNVTVTLASPGSGDILVLVNTANVSIVIEDTTGQTLAGNVTLGQWDTLTLLGRGTAWIELSRSNN
jgi:hypothetical protein